MSEVILRFHLAKDVGKPGSLEAILDTLQAMGFRIKHGHVGDLFEPIVKWGTPDRHPVDEDVRRGLHIAYEHGHLDILAMQDRSDEYNYLGFWFELKWEDDSSGSPLKTRVYLNSDDTPLFTQEKYHRDYYAQLLLLFAKELYAILHPVFGSIDFCSKHTREKDVQALEIPHIYWANFFGPEYVEKYGKEYFLNAPGWLHEELDDGGMLYVLAPVMARRVKGYKALVEEVKAYFGLEQVRCEKKRKPKRAKKGLDV
jgi:hypothetical protein